MQNYCQKAEGSALRFVSVKSGNISGKFLSKVLRSFVKNFERLQLNVQTDVEAKKNFAQLSGK